LIAFETKVDEVVILGNNLSTRSREVQRIRLLSATEIVKLENKVLRQK
jgi:hypothetical protein